MPAHINIFIKEAYNFISFRENCLKSAQFSTRVTEWLL